MRRSYTCVLSVLVVVCLLVVPSVAGGKEIDRPSQTQSPVATIEVSSGSLTWQPSIKFERLQLRIAGPSGDFEVTFAPGEPVVFDLTDETGGPLADGSYTWSLVATPQVDDSLRLRLEAARKEGDERFIKDLSASNSQTGYFTIADGLAVDPNVSERGLTMRDIVHNDDVIIDGSLCVGFDCVNGESFGFDTIRLKENNLRIKFDDTSNSASFPDNDWQLTANDTTNGGAEKFSIDDISNGRTPFTIEALAPSHSLYVDDGGRIGFGTSTPVVELHVKDGDSPTLRLEQDGSSGFTPQTWDVAGNETNYFIRDATNGSKLPFRIRPNAPSNSIFIDTDGDVGMGTSSPSSRLHVAGDLEVNDRVNIVELDEMPGFQMTSTTPRTWEVEMDGADNFQINDSSLAGAEFLINDSNSANPGRVVIGNDLSVTGALTKGSGAFKIDHPLDPGNKYLSHSFVESPDMMNIYNGNTQVDEDGEAWVQMPEYFEALNQEFRYQLTSIGGPAPNLHVLEEISDNRFKIAGAVPGSRVSWQVTGVRHDAFAKAHRIKVEEDKATFEQGFYLHPKVFGQPSSKSVSNAEPVKANKAKAQSAAAGKE